MEEQFHRFISNFLELHDEEFQAIMKQVVPRDILKKEHLVEASHVCRELVFFVEGYFRFYHYTSDGTEVTSDFYFAPNLVTSYTSLVTGLPSQVYVQAMEDMQLFVIRKDGLLDLYNRYHRIDRLGRLVAEHVAITSEKHLFNLLNQSAAERYRYLLDRYPQYIRRIPLQYIASYLGIKKETLSRVRKKIR